MWFLTPIFYFLPKAVLAAIIIVSVVGLIDIKLPISLWKSHKVEALLLFVTFIVTSTVGMTEGIASGVSLSMTLEAFLRPEKKFDSVDDLRIQIKKDILRAKELRGQN